MLLPLCFSALAGRMMKPLYVIKVTDLSFFLTQDMADAWKICIFALGEDRMRFGNAKSENFVFICLCTRLLLFLYVIKVTDLSKM